MVGIVQLKVAQKDKYFESLLKVFSQRTMLLNEIRSQACKGCK